MFRTLLPRARSERSASGQGRKALAPRFCRPRLERLEDRCVLSTLVGLSDNHLLTFDSATPGTVTDVAVSGLQPNDTLAAIAFRPSDGQLFGVSFEALYQLDAATGSATLVRDGIPVITAVAGASFDPTSGKLRVAGGPQQRQNLLIDPNSGAFTTESAFHYRAGDLEQGHDPQLTALAYTNEVAHATTTTLYAFEEFNARDLSIVGGPNGNPSPDTGELSTVAALTLPFWNAFTIGGADNTAYGVLSGPSGNDLYKVDLGTGTGSLVGKIGSTRGQIGLAVKPDGAATAPTTLSVRDAAVSESTAGPVTADFTVKLSAASTQTVTVNYSTANDTAFAGRDYQAAHGTLTFTPGQTLQTIHVLITADAPSALPETFFVQLSGPLGASLARAVAVGTVRADAPPQPLVPSGIYVEDFSDDKDLSKPAFDSTGVFQHFFSLQGQAHTVNDPTDTNEPTFGYRIDTGGPPPAVTFPSPTLIVSGATDRVTFPNLVLGTHVAFAAVDVTALAGTATVRIVGENGVFEESVAVGQPTKTVSVGEEHVLPSGLELGPISEIDLSGTVAGFDNVKVLVVPDRPPNANDVFADTPPDTPVVIDVLAHDSSQDGSPLRIVSVGPTDFPGARVNTTGGTVTYFPAKGYKGMDTFPYTIEDGHGETATGTVHVLVQGPPVIHSDSFKLDPRAQPSLVVGSLLTQDGRDAGGNALSYPKAVAVLVSKPQHGTLDFHADGTFTYTPTEHAIAAFPFATFGSDSFTWLANDGLDSNVATVTIAQQFPPVIARSHSYAISDQAAHGRPNNKQDYVMHGDDDLAVTPKSQFLFHGLLEGATVGGQNIQLDPNQLSTTEVDVAAFLRDDGSIWSDEGIVAGDPDIFHDFPYVTSPHPGRLNPDGSFYFRPHPPAAPYLTHFDYRVTVIWPINGTFYRLQSYDVPVEINVTSPGANATGIPAGVEDGAPNGGDGNGDGIPDRLQDNVASLPSRLNGAPGPYVTFVSPSTKGSVFEPLHTVQETQLFDVHAIDNPSPADAPTDAQGQPVAFPFGFFHFQVTGLAPGEATAVEMVLSSPLPAHPTFYKYGHTPKNPTPHWYQFLYHVQTDDDDASQTGAEFLDSTHILLHFVQGGRGDDFNVQNGIIEDPGGPAYAPVPRAVGAFDPSTATWYLRGGAGGGPPDGGQFAFGGAAWLPVLGDWSGGGTTTVGAVDVTGASNPNFAVWYLRSSNSAGPADAGTFGYGEGGWLPVAGDWAGSGHSGIGMFDPATATWYLRNEASAGAPDAGVFQYGVAGGVPVVGDWTGTGHLGIGVFDPATFTWYLRSSVSAGAPDVGVFQYGGLGWLPVAGDWAGSGHAGIGGYDPSTGLWYLRNEANAGGTDAGQFAYGGLGWLPVAVAFAAPQHLLAAGGEGPGGGAPLSADQLQAAVSAALARLSAAGIDPALLSALSSAQYDVAALPPGVLGLTDVAARHVTISADAAGYGWFADASAGSDAAFAPGVPGSPLVALPGSLAAGKEDLLTAVLHEMGHLAGRADSDSGLMAAALAAGTRDTLALDQVFSQGLR
jgi:VCBS repeat-containing protein